MENLKQTSMEELEKTVGGSDANRPHRQCHVVCCKCEHEYKSSYDLNEMINLCNNLNRNKEACPKCIKFNVWTVDYC